MWQDDYCRANRKERHLDGVLRDSELALRIMKSLARLQGTQSSVGAIKADLSPNAVTGGVHENTIYSYIGALKKIFVVEDMPAWCPNLRCKTSGPHYRHALFHRSVNCHGCSWPGARRLDERPQDFRAVL